MWSSRLHRAALLCASSIPMALCLSGCIQPLYGTLGPGGLESELQRIKVEPIPDRFGHYLEKELIFAFNGSGADVAPKYRLVVAIKQKVQAPTIDTVTSRATSATVIDDAEYQLIPVGGDKPVMSGVAFAVASYDRFSQRLSNVRAARDAEERGAKSIAEQIRTQIAARLATRG